MNEFKIKRALVSVSDKTGLGEFCLALKKFGADIIATGSTWMFLKGKGISAEKVSDFTGFPELIGGRVKTLHPKIHAGILADRSRQEHLMELKEKEIPLIDLVVVNLYPFRETIAGNCTEKEAIEKIDIGGVALLRAAAKNYESVAVLSTPRDYSAFLEELASSGGISLETRRKLAAKAFSVTAQYDSIIARFFSPLYEFPEKISICFEKKQDCRYGENPHQAGAVYTECFPCLVPFNSLEQLNGKPLSFNNFLDVDSAVRIALEFDEPAAVIVKHNNPCGVASAEKLSDAFQKALDCDSKSAFGSVIALNKKCDFKTAEKITAFFNEVVVAPSFDAGALDKLCEKKNLRVLKLPFSGYGRGADFRRIEGGLLLQEADAVREKAEWFDVVSRKKPSGDELRDLEFAFRVVKNVKSNAIVLAKGLATIGIGAGQMSRVDAVELAIKKASGREKGAVLASDGFFPFRDNIDRAADADITAIVAPHGSIRDNEIISAANERGLCLLFAERRHFRH